jgi:NADH:ubiquinone oxidoreductase subunit 5 (subunit L)/multisubunit Na+/H+ antiporter MnhA subunit
MISEDDDSVWRAWASMYQGTYRGQYKTFQRARQEYYNDYAFYIFWGAFFYVLVGLLDYLRYWDTLNTYMILAGSAGMLSGSTDSRSMAIIWECVSLHLYLLGSFTLLGRDHNHCNVRESGNNVHVGDYVGEHDYEDSNNNLVADRWQSIFRTGDLLFLIGSILDVLGSYFDIAGAVGFWVAYTDVVACYLWLLCGLTEIVAELYFLRKQLLACCYDDNDGCWEIHCY